MFLSCLSRRWAKKQRWEQLSGKNKSHTTTWRAIRYKWKFKIIELKNVSFFFFNSICVSMLEQIPRLFLRVPDLVLQAQQSEGLSSDEIPQESWSNATVQFTQAWSTFI